MQSFGENRQIGTPAAIRAILGRIATAMAETIPEIEAYARDHAGFAEIGARMIAAWRQGISDNQG